MTETPGLRVSTERRRSLGLASVVFAAAVFLYAQSLGFGFTRFDDLMIETKEVFLLSRGLVDALRTDAFMETDGRFFYRPLQTMTFMIDARLAGGARPAMFHATSIIIHGLACLSFFVFLTTLGYSVYHSFAGGVLMAVHPLFVQAVAWIPGRGDLLLGLFGVLTVATGIIYARRRQSRWALVHACCLAAALLAKETAITLPALLILYFILVKRERPDSVRSIALGGIWALLCFAYLWLRATVMVGLPEADSFGLKNLLINLRTIPETVASFFLPLGIQVMPAYTAWRTALGLGMLAVLVWLLIRLRVPSTRRVLFAAGWIVVMLLPGMFTRILEGMAYDYLNHRTYLPMMGMVIILLEVTRGLGVHSRSRGPAVLSLFVILAVMTFVYSGNYRDPRRFYTSAVAGNPRSAQAHNNLGNLYREKGDLDSALVCYDRSLTLRPRYMRARRNRAAVRHRLENDSGAIADYDILVNRGSIVASDYFVRGLSHHRLGNLQAAVNDFHAATRFDPTHRAAWKNLGVLLLDHRPILARTALQQATRLGDEQAESLLQARFGKTKPRQSRRGR